MTVDIIVDIIVTILFVFIGLYVILTLMMVAKDFLHIAYLYYKENAIYKELDHPEIFYTDIDFSRIEMATNYKKKRKLITSHYVN